MNQNEQPTLIPIEDFDKLTRDEMVAELRQADPNRAKGRSKARKEELSKLYYEVLQEKLSGEIHNGTKTGRLRSDQPNQDNPPKPDSPTGRLATEPPALRELPPRSEEAKELAESLREALDMNADYASIETRPLAGVPAAGVLDSLKTEPTPVVLHEEAHVISSGADYPMMADRPVEMVVPRKEVVARRVSKLGRDKIMLLAKYKAVPRDGNRRARKIRQALAKKILRFLPKDITLEEAVGVLS